MASNQPQLGLFSLSLQSFVETLTDEQKNEFEFSTLEDFQAAIVAIQNQQSSVRKMRNLARLRCFLEAMDQYGKVIEVFVNASELVCFIWGPAKFLLQIASAYTEAFDALLDAYQQIGESLPLLSQYQALFQRNPSMRKVLALIYNDILEFHKKALKYFRQRTWRQLFHATWKTFRTEFSGLLVKIQRHGRLVESQANLVEFEQLFDQMEMGRAAAKADFQRHKEEEERNRRIAVRNWLSAASTDVDQERGVSVRKHNPGSGRWLLGNNQVQGWFNPEFCSAPLVWINGIPGAGKTVLASLMIEELQQLRSTHPITLGFFYCKHKDSQRNTFNAVARAILAQILNQNEELLPYLFEKASTSGEIVLESPSLTKELLETALKSSEKVYIVIDGLDECDPHEKKAIIQWFQSVVAALPDTEFDSMRCMFISQDDGEVGKLLSNIPAIRIRPEDTRADIQTYVTIWGKKIQEKFDLPDEKREGIIATVVERADGMFLFAKLVMENLFSQTKRENFTKELEPARFPRGLEDAYARIVDRILGDPSTKEDAKQLLGWLVCAKRPLKWREIQCAVSIDLDAKDIDLAERQLRVGSKILCGSLVEQRSDGSVEMVHLTARFFLISQKHINLASEEFELAKLCLGYLNFRCFQESTPESETEEFALKGYYSFLDYAALHWVDHLEEWVPTGSHTGSVNSIEDLIQEFLRNFWSKSEHRTTAPIEMRTKFSRFKACEFFDQLTKAVFTWKKLQKAYGTDSVDSESVELVQRICKARKALEKKLASSKGNDILERSLVTFYGPEVFKCPRISCKHFTDGFSTEEARDQHFQKHKRPFTCTYSGCPFGTMGFNSIRDLNLHITNSHEVEQYGETQFPITQEPGDIDIKRAIRARSTREVEKWLEQFNGAPENAPISKFQQSAILAAINQGDEVIFRLLFDGAPNISTIEISQLLNSALAKGQVTIANIILDHPRANPFDGSGNCESPVATAIQLRRIEVLKRIGDDEDVNWNNRILIKSSVAGRVRTRWTTPLFLAATSGNLEFVKLIFKKEGVDLNSRDSSSRTPLQLAIEKEQFEIVKLFLGKEGVVDLDSKDFRGRTPLLWAAENGNLEIVKLLIEKEGVDINSKDSRGRTSLLWAAENGHLEIVKLLIKKEGVDINSKDFRGRTPLLWAAENGHLEIVKLLIEKEGVDINSKDSEGRTPLSWAAENGHLEIVKLLIEEEGVDIDSKDSEGRTPLLWAAENGHLEIVKLLIEKEGVDINSKDSRGRTPLLWAAENGHLEIVKLLIEKEGVDINSKDSRGRTSLLCAAGNGHLEIVKLLIKKEGVDINSKDFIGETPLFLAASNGHLEIVKLLIEKEGVDINSKDSCGRTLLLWAAGNGHLEIFKLLIEKEGLDINSKDSKGRTPLSWAAWNGNLEIFKLLIEKEGLDINSKDSEGRTSLSWAVGNGNLELVKLLIEKKGLDIDSEDWNGWTQLLWAAQGRNLEVVKLLIEEYVDLNFEFLSDQTPLLWAVRTGYLELVELLIEKEGLDIDPKDSKGRTPLSWAAENGEFEIVRLLVEKQGVDAESKDSDGRTPLSWAAGSGHLEVVELLEQKGVNIDSTDFKGRTPLWAAARNGKLEVVKVLISKDGVNVNAKDSNDRTPLWWAAGNGHLEVTNVLIQQKGVDLGSKDSSGRTPLSWAAENGHVKIVELLGAKLYSNL